MFLQYSRFGGVGLLLHECWVKIWGLFSAYKFEIKWSILPLAVSSGSADLEVLAVKAVRQVKRVEVEDITESGARLFSSQFLVLWHWLRRWETTSRWSWLMQYPASKDGRTGSIWNIFPRPFPDNSMGNGNDKKIPRPCHRVSHCRGCKDWLTSWTLCSCGAIWLLEEGRFAYPAHKLHTGST